VTNILITDCLSCPHYIEGDSEVMCGHDDWPGDENFELLREDQAGRCSDFRGLRPPWQCPLMRLRSFDWVIR